MNLEGIFVVVSTILCSLACFTGCHQNVPPGVHPQHYQNAPVQHIPQQHMGHQQIPVQQMPMQQQPQMHMQQPPQHMQQPPQHTQQQIPVHQPQMHQPMHHVDQGHHGQHPQLLNVANIAQEKEHIAEHLSVPIDTSKMSEQELQFHYFKMHDADNNNKLDGCELIKSLIHWHAQGHTDPSTGQKPVEEKLFKDEELVSLIDPILKLDDANNDGFIDYPEFVRAQQKAAAAGGSQPPQR